MNMISDLVERLRVESKSMGKYGTDYMATLLTQAADTIVRLSEKVRADRPQGEWIGEADGYADGELVYDTWYCSNCDYVIDDDEPPTWNYCPNCGTRMKDTDNETN